ncbi:hypothetical protein [Amycolatopsis sp. CA-128772]|uniref:hypothetical protein n=1 Tax=Amycolatopsis sp. CA-128772 TaxID=2073159 RepID=UPI0018ECE0D0|nr:hypothetical protein [Amycolatopsis sp. CA-128772]
MVGYAVAAAFQEDPRDERHERGHGEQHSGLGGAGSLVGLLSLDVTAAVSARLFLAVGWLPGFVPGQRPAGALQQHQPLPPPQHGD